MAGIRAHYYQCLLSGLPPEYVPLGLPAAAYKALLARADVAADAGSDEDVDVDAIQDMPSMGLLLDRPMVGRSREGDGQPCAKSAGRGARADVPQSQVLSGLSDVMAAIWENLGCRRRSVESLPLCDADVVAVQPDSVVAAAVVAGLLSS